MAPLLPGEHHRMLKVDKRPRHYLLHVPASYDGKKAVPVVLALHGGASNARQMVGFCGLNDKADQVGFLVVYPSGTGRTERLLTWNAGNCCGYAQEENIDDVAFVRAVLDDLATTAKIDTQRVYAGGISNGGMMAYRLASELSERIAAIAPVGGPMGTASCRPRRPVSVIHFHGTTDQFAPFAGGTGKKSMSKIKFYSVEHSIQAWVKANGCREEPVSVRLPTKVEDGTRVVRKTYGGGKDASEVVLVTIEGGGHTWPGREPRLKFLGTSTANISANEAMWDFFKKHPLKTRPVETGKQ
jgi:polyhydroxybutyrate depolymerase